MKTKAYLYMTELRRMITGSAIGEWPPSCAFNEKITAELKDIRRLVPPSQHLDELDKVARGERGGTVARALLLGPLAYLEQEDARRAGRPSEIDKRKARQAAKWARG